jgi:hypothetical protein
MLSPLWIAIHKQRKQKSVQCNQGFDMVSALMANADDGDARVIHDFRGYVSVFG